MVAEIDPAAGPVIELGAGTGNITQAILDARRRARRPPFDRDEPRVSATACARAFPRLNVYQMSAGDVRRPAGCRARRPSSRACRSCRCRLQLQRDILTGTFQRVRARRQLRAIHLWPQAASGPRRARGTGPGLAVIATRSGGTCRPPASIVSPATPEAAWPHCTRALAAR